MTGFVKSAGTSVPTGRSQAELEKLLRRYGATGFGVSNDYERQRIVVAFRVPDSPEKGAPQIPIRLEVDVRTVYDALFGRPTTRKWDSAAQEYVNHWNPKGYIPKLVEQAERVAWRQLILWVDVRWWGAWRKYAFFPGPNTLYEQDCLRDIAAFCEQRTAEHRLIVRRRRELEGA